MDFINDLIQQDFNQKQFALTVFAENCKNIRFKANLAMRVLDSDPEATYEDYENVLTTTGKTLQNEVEKLTKLLNPTTEKKTGKEGEEE